MTKPEKLREPMRVQRLRKKGFKLQEASRSGLPVVFVGRPTKWGNPFKVLFEKGYWVVRDKAGNYWSRLYTEKEGAAERAVECYSGWIDGQIGLDLKELKGKDLACFCSLSCDCHADVLLKRVTRTL